MLLTIKSTKLIKQKGKQKILFVNFGIPVPKRSTHIINHSLKKVAQIHEKNDNSYGISNTFEFDEMDVCEFINSPLTNYSYDDVNEIIRKKNDFASGVMCIDVKSVITEVYLGKAASKTKFEKIKEDPKMVLKREIVNNIKKALKHNLRQGTESLLAFQYQKYLEDDDVNFYDLINNLDIEIK